MLVETAACIKGLVKSFPILSLEVKDLLLVENESGMIIDTKKWLSLNFKMKDIGWNKILLRVKIVRYGSKTFIGLIKKLTLRRSLDV